MVETLETQEKRGIWNVFVYKLEIVFTIEAAGLNIKLEYFPVPGIVFGSGDQIVPQKQKRLLCE